MGSSCGCQGQGEVSGGSWLIDEGHYFMYVRNCMYERGTTVSRFGLVRSHVYGDGLMNGHNL